jgi:hypothetical protein
MKKRPWFVGIAVVFCLTMDCLWAAGAGEPNAPQGVLLLPEGISVELVSPERGTLILPDKDGQARLGQGKYRLESWTLEKKDDQGRLWKLSGDLTTARMVEVGAESVRVDIKPEPIVCKLDIYPAPDAMNLTLGLTGRGGERLRVWGDVPGIKQDQLPQPSFELYNTDKSFTKTYDFQSQCCGNYRFNWMPPADTAGPFWVNIKVAGPFTLDFEPRNLSAEHAKAISQQQLAHKRMIQGTILIAAIYIGIIAIAAVVLIKLRKRIAAAGWGRAKLPTRWLVIVLGIFMLLLVLDPLLQLAMGDSEASDAIVQSVTLAAVILIGALVVWAVRKAPVKWPFVTIVLYGIIFVLVLIPAVFVIFLMAGRPHSTILEIKPDYVAVFYGGLLMFSEPGVWIVWLIIIALLIVQALLLIIPVRVTHGRPKPRRGIWWTAAMAGLLYTVLLFFAALSILAALWGDDLDSGIPMVLFWVVVCILPVNWIVWAVVFGLFSKSIEPASFVRRLMQWLVRGSILELLIAVPSHIIVRHRDVCCAHGLTAAGITAGLAVMFFAFGPGLYFLYADRIRRRKPNLPESADLQSTEPASLPE